ncbi:uncharacterized protein LOC111614004 [Centruroides sculpturatus]|uniref:uncharacterized protein LOC111614004 n=1 Tax=Centruroides sculpturatus TaxID=218467 RepID=UPI000C6E0C0E|nr:uncharacterized protein LOC111614004 [Centruroides sculpturatus]
MIGALAGRIKAPYQSFFVPLRMYSLLVLATNVYMFIYEKCLKKYIGNRIELEGPIKSRYRKFIDLPTKEAIDKATADKFRRLSKTMADLHQDYDDRSFAYIDTDQLKFMKPRKHNYPLPKPW